MNDKELADAVVALGVGSHDLGYPANLSTHGYAIGGQVMSIITFTTDWRVAGALMEMVRTRGEVTKRVLLWINLMRDIRRIPVNAESLPRAIIEACVSAL